MGSYEVNCVTMTEASTSTSPPAQNLIFPDLPKPKEPTCQKIRLGFRYEGINSPETSSDDQPPPAELNEEMMDQLKNDFQDILLLQVKGVATAVTDPSSTTDTSCSFSLCLSAPSAMEESSLTGYHGPTLKEARDLRSIARKMSAKGRLDKLINVYVTERKSFVNAHFQKLWDEKLGPSDVQRLEWVVLEAKMVRWIRAVKCCLRGIFPLERQLSNHVFKGLGNDATGESCFVAIVGDYVAELLNFALALIHCRRSPERLQKILVLYRKFSCFRPDINSVFESEAAQGIRVGTEDTLSRLGGEVVSLTLSEFEDTLLREHCNDPNPGGAIHSSTEYVIGSVIGLVSESKETLMELITSKPAVVCGGDQMISDADAKELDVRMPLAAHLLWIIIVLRLNLERRSKFYQDRLLENLFMMNNVNYIVQQIRGSAALTEMIGDNYINKLTECVQESMTSFVSGTWDQLIYCLRHEGLNVSRVFAFRYGVSKKRPVSKKVLKDRFERFNSLFNGIHKTQMRWEVPDLELRGKLHKSIVEKLVPTYSSFLETFRSHIDGGRHPEKYIMYSAEELHTMVLRLFSYRCYL